MAQVDALYIKQYDTEPKYYGKVLDSNGNVVDLTGATGEVYMKNVGTGVLAIDGASVDIASDGSDGYFEYPWDNSSALVDTEVAGVYHIEFEITLNNNRKFTVPSNPDEPAIVIITADQDQT